MWSGPRNISTALMRSFGNRPDTFVVDEPFYAYYLATTGMQHPGYQDVIAAQPNDWRDVVSQITGPIPQGRAVWYQKLMTHHLLPEVELHWTSHSDFRHAFLIRDPVEMITSLDKILPNLTIDQTGVPQQFRLFQKSKSESHPLVLDSKDVLENPEGTLRRFCSLVGIEFLPQMLSWPPGPRETDGVWAPHWYGRVEQTTGFAEYKPKNEHVPSKYQPIVDECMAMYREMFELRLVVSDETP